MRSDVANGPGSRSEPMDMDEPTISPSSSTHRSRGLVVVEVRWEERNDRDALIRRVLSLLLRPPGIVDMESATEVDIADSSAVCRDFDALPER